MTTSVADALDYCIRTDICEFIFVAPYELGESVLEFPDVIPRIRILIAPGVSPSVRNTFSERYIPLNVGRLYSTLAMSRLPVVFAGGPLQITRRLTTALILSGRSRIICRRDDNSVGPVSIAALLLLGWRRRLAGWLRNLPVRHPAARMFHVLEERASPKGTENTSAELSEAHDQGPQDSTQLDHLVKTAQIFATPFEAVPGRVLLINDGLASGGAERQIVNTLTGLRKKEGVDASFLGERLACVKGLDFFRGDLEQAGISVETALWRSVNARDGLPSVAPEVADALCRLPAQAVESILNLTDEFRKRRPSVVHAWQDSTSVHAGIAAIICGVPRIVLSARNISPTGTPRFRRYLLPAYNALAKLPNVTFTNNSDAGAQSYANWLGLPRNRFVVLKNGVDIAGLDAEPPYSYDQLGIRDGAPVVCGIFRLTPTKRPLLWLKTAFEIAQSQPDVHFVIVGDGPLRRACVEQIEKSGLSGRFHLLGETPSPARLLRLSNALLLTSEMEGAANALLEAQCLGVPVICTDVGGNSDSIYEGVTGWISKSTDPNELAGLVVSAMTDTAKIASVKKEGRNFITNHFGLDRMVVETLGLYKL
jgi:glycosyltransferase involved in cell wall biosynthesis